MLQTSCGTGRKRPAPRPSVQGIVPDALTQRRLARSPARHEHENETKPISRLRGVGQAGLAPPNLRSSQKSTTSPCTVLGCLHKAMETPTFSGAWQRQMSRNMQQLAVENATTSQGREPHPKCSRPPYFRLCGPPCKRRPYR